MRWFRRTRAEICLWRAHDVERQSRHFSSVDHIAQLRLVRHVGRQGRRTFPQLGSRLVNYRQSFITVERAVIIKLFYFDWQAKWTSSRGLANHWTVTWLNGEPQIVQLLVPASLVLIWLVQLTKPYLSSTETPVRSIVKLAAWFILVTSAGSILDRKSSWWAPRIRF